MCVCMCIYVHTGYVDPIAAEVRRDLASHLCRAAHWALVSSPKPMALSSKKHVQCGN